jgi:SAM-dependent methyltransferase
MERVLPYVPRSGRHLDVGTGRGDGTVLLGPAVARCIGLEYGLKSAVLAADRGCTITRGDARRLPFAAARFDSITCLDVLEHVPRPLEAVAEMARVLRPGGVLILQTPNRELFKERVLSGLRSLGFRQRQPYDRPLPLAALRRLLGDAGFAVEAERRVRCWDDRAAVRAVSWSRLFLCRRAGRGGAG